MRTNFQHFYTCAPAVTLRAVFSPQTYTHIQKGKNKMNRKTVRTAALVSALCLMVTGCGKADKKEPSVPKATVASLSRNDLSQTFSVSGLVESSERDSTITTELTGTKVLKVNCSVGDTVKAGDIVCELDSTEIEQEIGDLRKMMTDSDTLYDYRYEKLKKDLESTRQSGRIQLQETEDRIAELRKNISDYESQYNSSKNRYNDLCSEANDIKNQISSCESMEQAAVLTEQYQAKMQEAAGEMASYERADEAAKQLRSSLKSAESSLESQKISVQSSIDNVQYQIDTYSLTEKSSSENQKQLEELEKSLENTKIRADRDGVVSVINAEAGKVCREGIIMSITGASEMNVHISVSEEDLLRIEKDMEAVITIPACRDEEFTGAVDRVIDIKSAQGFDAYVRIDDTDKFRIGMNAKVKIKTVNAPDVLSVKSKAVFEEDGKFYVYEAEKSDGDNYVLRKAEVTKGLEKGSLVEISGEGLDENDYIVQVPKRFSDGQTVTVKVGDNSD